MRKAARFIPLAAWMLSHPLLGLVFVSSLVRGTAPRLHDRRPRFKDPQLLHHCPYRPRQVDAG